VGIESEDDGEGRLCTYVEVTTEEGEEIFIDLAPEKEESATLMYVV